MTDPRDDSGDRRSRRSRATVPAAVLLLPALYVLSVGPVGWMLKHGYISLETSTWIGNTLYSPLRWCVEHSEPFRKLLSWYIRLWI